MVSWSNNTISELSIFHKHTKFKSFVAGNSVHLFGDSKENIINCMILFSFVTLLFALPVLMEMK